MNNSDYKCSSSILVVPNSSERRTRLDYIDRSTGIAILLVVVGHMGNTNYQNVNYLSFKHLIYVFHMPLFMAISGFIMCYTWIPPERFSDYARYISKKAKRLMPSFVVFSGAIFIAKLLLQDHSFIYNHVTGYEDIYNIILRPAQGPAGFLWYIYVLFEFYVIMPLLLTFTGRLFPLLLIPSIFLYFISFSMISILQVDLFCRYIPFFIIGVLWAQHRVRVEMLLRKWGLYFAILFTIGLLYVLFTNMTKSYIAFILLGSISIPSVVWLSIMPPFRDADFLSLWGRNVFVIYLLNTSVIGILRNLLYTYFGENGFAFIVASPLMVTAAIYFPIYILNLYVRTANLYKKWI